MGSSSSRITKEELDLVEESWKVVAENPEENGVIILKTFLEKYNYYSRFEKFNGIPVEDLPSNETFRAHALAVIKALDHVTKNIYDEDNLKRILFELGREHAKRDITEVQFKELKLVILEVLKFSFKLTEPYLEAWNKTLDIAFVFIFDGIRGN